MCELREESEETKTAGKQQQQHLENMQGFLNYLL